MASGVLIWVFRANLALKYQPDLRTTTVASLVFFCTANLASLAPNRAKPHQSCFNGTDLASKMLLFPKWTWGAMLAF